MLNLELNSEQAEVLREVVEGAFKEVDLEVFRTDAHEFREMLKQRRRILEQLLEKLPAQPIEH